MQRNAGRVPYTGSGHDGADLRRRIAAAARSRHPGIGVLLGEGRTSRLRSY